MPDIQPISDLCSYFAEITRDMQSSGEYQFKSNIYNKLCEAEIQAVEIAERLSHEEVMAAARIKLGLDTSREK
ncbi:MAG: hypothetical protein HDT14_09775 [Oscillibacter sp.]|nr:hypothetical protein [Oscillibacter sp.]